MSTQRVSPAVQNASPRGNLNNVQSVQRFMVWILIFGVLSVITGLFSAISFAIHPILGFAVLSVMGLISLIIPGMVSSSLYIISEYERVVILRLGEFVSVKGPGRFWVFPYPPSNESVAALIDIRVKTRVITAAETLTEDNVPVGCEAVVFWRVEDPQTAALKVQNYREAVFQAANSAIKDTVGTLELSDLLSNREMVSHRLKTVIDEAAASFGVDVTSVEITDIRVPPDLIQELSVLAQSRRAASAKVAEADAEKAIAQKFREAADLMDGRSMEIYRLNVLERIGREEGSQIVIYGLGGGDPDLDRKLAASAAGSLIKSS